MAGLRGTEGKNIRSRVVVCLFVCSCCVCVSSAAAAGGVVVDDIVHRDVWEDDVPL